MRENDIELFKCALIEGLSNRIDRQVAECTEDVVTSASHNRAMNKIVKGSSSFGIKKIIALLVAAALLLTGCAVVYRDEIRTFIEEVYESFMTLKYSEQGEENKIIEEVYELTYLPEGYELNDTFTCETMIRSIFVNENLIISFEQFPLDRAHSYIDIEKGYKKIVEITNWEIYYRYSSPYHYYFWNVGDYYLKLVCDLELPIEELQKIVDGAKIK